MIDPNIIVLEIERIKNSESCRVVLIRIWSIWVIVTIVAKSVTTGSSPYFRL